MFIISFFKLNLICEVPERKFTIFDNERWVNFSTLPFHQLGRLYLRTWVDVLLLNLCFFRKQKPKTRRADFVLIHEEQEIFNKVRTKINQTMNVVRCFCVFCRADQRITHTYNQATWLALAILRVSKPWKASSRWKTRLQLFFRSLGPQQNGKKKKRSHRRQ